MRSFFACLLVFGGFLFSASGQEHDHNFHLGVGGATAKIIGESGLKPAIHVHLIRQLGESRKWGIGLGYESIFEDSPHQGVYLLFNYNPLENIHLSLAPGLSYGLHHSVREINAAAHLEAVYEFEAGVFHFGPMVGAGIDRRDAHLSAGLHVGIGF